MSDSPSGILAYGYDLGGKEAGWKFSVQYNTPLKTNLSLSLDIEKAERILLAQIVDFTETWETTQQNGFHTREKEAKQKLGIEFVRYGSWDYSGYILASTIHMTNDWGHAKVIEISLDHSAAERLDRALRTLGIMPEQTEPKWILTSFYG